MQGVLTPAAKACCTLPPVEVEYTPKGSYSDVAGIKSYVTGPADSKKIILSVYDVFGFSNQILQGALFLSIIGVEYCQVCLQQAPICLRPRDTRSSCPTSSTANTPSPHGSTAARSAYG